LQQYPGSEFVSHNRRGIAGGAPRWPRDKSPGWKPECAEAHCPGCGKAGFSLPELSASEFIPRRRAEGFRQFQPSLRDSGKLGVPFPGNELPGYCQMSLRDKKSLPISSAAQTPQSPERAHWYACSLREKLTTESAEFHRELCLRVSPCPLWFEIETPHSPDGNFAKITPNGSISALRISAPGKA